MSSAARARPFPWTSLEATRGVDVAALRALRGWVTQRVRLDALGAALTSLVGEEVRLVPGRATGAGAPRTRSSAREPDGGVGVVLTSADDDSSVLLDVESALAAALVSRVVRRPPPVAVNVATPPSAALAGAFAALVIASARRAHATASPLRVVSAGVASVLEAEFGGGDPELLAVSFKVLVGDVAYAARLLLRRKAPAPLSREWTTRALAALGPMPIGVPIVACATRACAADVASLRVGDVWLPGIWPLELAPETGRNAALRGPVLLAAPGGTSGVRAQLVDRGRLVLSGEADGVCGAEGEMTDGDGETALLEAVGDVPIVVRVEIGEAQMPARDWACLGRGDVITLGRRAGDLVVLRVGGVAIARGELVTVDGEVGVRIAERLAGDVTSA